MQKEGYVYRIPKHVDSRNTFWGMDWKGWAITALAAVISVAQFLLFPAHHLNGLMFSLARSVVIVGGPVIFARDPQILAIIRQSRYHKTHKILIRWEGDPNAYLKAKIQVSSQKH